jgi:hypothetical protein
LSLKIFYFLKILTDVYHREEVIELFKNFEKQFKEIDIYENIIKKINEDSESDKLRKNLTNNKESINSFIDRQNSKNMTIKGKENKEIYNNSGIINNNQEKNKNNIEENNLDKNKELVVDNNAFNKNQSIHQHSSTMLLHRVYNNKDLNSNVANLNKEGIANNKINYVIFLFLSQIMKRIQIKDDEKKMGRDFSFFANFVCSQEKSLQRSPFGRKTQFFDRVNPEPCGR